MRDKPAMAAFELWLFKQRTADELLAKGERSGAAATAAAAARSESRPALRSEE